MEGLEHVLTYFQFAQRLLNVLGRGGMTQAIRDVADVTQRGRLVTFEDVRVEVRSFSAAHRFEEIGEVAFGLAFEGADQFAFRVEQRFARDDPFCAVENPAALESRVERFGLQPARFGDDRLGAKIMDDDLCVGRLCGVDVTETPAVADDGPAQAGDAQAPAANVRRVNVVVAQLAVARVPEPVPVIVKLGPGQLRHRRRAGPQVVIPARRDFTWPRASDGTAPAIDNAAGQLDFAEVAFVDV